MKKRVVRQYISGLPIRQYPFSPNTDAATNNLLPLPKDSHQHCPNSESMATICRASQNQRVNALKYQGFILLQSLIFLGSAEHYCTLAAYTCTWLIYLPSHTSQSQNSHTYRTIGKYVGFSPRPTNIKNRWVTLWCWYQAIFEQSVLIRYTMTAPWFIS